MESFHHAGVPECGEHFGDARDFAVLQELVGEAVDPAFLGFPFRLRAVEALQELGEPDHVDELMGDDIHGEGQKPNMHIPLDSLANHMVLEADFEVIAGLASAQPFVRASKIPVDLRESEIGDFVVKRADGLFAYQLAVVVDDAFQGITHVVRGSDLLYSTPRQIYLQRLLGLTTPAYLHLPVAVNAAGEKLSKQTLAPAITRDNAVATLIAALRFLRQQPPDTLRGATVEQLLQWGTTNWKPEKLTNCRQFPV